MSVLKKFLSFDNIFLREMRKRKEKMKYIELLGAFTKNLKEAICKICMKPLFSLTKIAEGLVEIERGWDGPLPLQIIAFTGMGGGGGAAGGRRAVNWVGA